MEKTALFYFLNHFS